MGLSASLKKLLLASLPEPLARFLKKRYYARALRHTAPGDLRDGPIVARLVRKGMRAVDVGANIGYYTKVLSELVGPDGTVHAFEPVPQTFDMMRSNLSSWKCTNVTCHPRAVSDGEASVTMEVPRYGSGGDDFYGARIVTTPSEGSHRRVSVRTVSLDKVFSGREGPVDFIKLDAMGNERKCIEGAVDLIHREEPALLVAFYSDPNDEGSDGRWIFRALTEEHGFNVFWFDGTSLRPWKAGETSYRYFFLKERHRALLDKET